MKLVALCGILVLAQLLLINCDSSTESDSENYYEPMQKPIFATESDRAYRPSTPLGKPKLAERVFNKKSEAEPASYQQDKQEQIITDIIQIQKRLQYLSGETSDEEASQPLELTSVDTSSELSSSEDSSTEIESQEELDLDDEEYVSSKNQDDDQEEEYDYLSNSIIDIDLIETEHDQPESDGSSDDDGAVSQADVGSSGSDANAASETDFVFSSNEFKSENEVY